MSYELKNNSEQDAGVALARKLGELMYQLNVADVASLVTQNPAERDSVYHHLSEALKATLRQLGIADADDISVLMASGEPEMDLREYIRPWEVRP